MREAAPGQRQRDPVLEQVIAEQVPLQVPLQMVRLLADARPQRAREHAVRQRALPAEAQEERAPVGEPQGRRVRLPADLTGAGIVMLDPMKRHPTRVGEP